MVKPVDLNGRRFGRWSILRRGKNTRSGKATWVCRCDCGTVKEVSSTNLVRGASKSCGCLAHEATALRSRTHGACSGGKDPEYRIWINMKSRCYSKANNNYKNYGGRGIKVCNRWKHSYDNFISDMGYLPMDKMSIDRIDNNGNYTPENCRWATTKEQNRNYRRNVVLTYRGISMVQTDWAGYLNVTPDVLGQYLRRGGHTIDEAVKHYNQDLADI